jgi:hypothetical protein
MIETTVSSFSKTKQTKKRRERKIGREEGKEKEGEGETFRFI